MIGHITQTQLAAMDGKKDNPFANTDVFTHSEKGLTKVGTVLATSKDALEKIANHNYVYTPFYTRKKADSGLYENFGAIIVGTKDQSLTNKLHFAAMNAMMADMKK